MFSKWHVRLLSLLNRAREGFWLIPSLMSVAALVLGMLMPMLDRGLDVDSEVWRESPFIYATRPAGAREMLAAVAASSITVAATVFSITIATLALTSQQFGPRLLRAFIADRAVQFSLGTFLATFLYPLMVLRSVRAGEDHRFVPDLSILLALILAVMAVGVLIFFIDHMANMIRAPQIIHSVGNDLDEVIESRVPPNGRRGDSDEDVELLHGPDIPDSDAPVAARAPTHGYLTYIDEAAIVRLGAKRRCIFRVASPVGSYVTTHAPLIYCQDASRLSERDNEALVDAFGIGPHRTNQQDIIYGFNQLVELALRSISPSLNDPFTAHTCIDRITASLVSLADRPFPDPRLRDEAGQVRLIVVRPTFDELVALSFGPIRRYARGDASLLESMLRGLTVIAGHVPRDRPQRLQALRIQANAIGQLFVNLEQIDRRALDAALAQFNQEIARSPTQPATRSEFAPPGAGRTPGAPAEPPSTMAPTRHG